MKKFLSSVTAGVIVLLFSGCASVSTQTTTLALEGGGKMNLTEVDWGVKGHGGAVTKHYVAEVIAPDGKQGKVEVYDRNSQVGTGQQVLTNIAGATPGAIAQVTYGALYAGAIKSAAKEESKAIEYAAKVGADAMVEQAKLGLEATQYAVDNTEPSISVTTFNLSASAEGGEAVALTQQQQNQGQSQIAESASSAGAFTDTNVDIGVNTAPPCEGTCGF